MIDEKRMNTTPVQHIRNLINSITDEKLTITYYDPIDPTYTRTYDVSSTAADVEEFVSSEYHLGHFLREVADLHLLGVYLCLSPSDKGHDHRNDEYYCFPHIVRKILRKDTLLKAKKTVSIKINAIFVD